MQTSPIDSDWLKEQRPNWISGEAKPSVSGATFRCAENKDLNIAESDYLDVVAAVKSSIAAGPMLAKIDLSARFEILKRFLQLLSQDAAYLAKIESQETMASLDWTLAESIGRAQQSIEDTLATVGQNKVLCENRFNLEVTGLILPAFTPSLHFLRRWIPLFLIGGSMIVKPAQVASGVILRLAQLANVAGVPAGALNILCGKGSELGEALLQHPSIHRILLLGNTETGRRALSILADNLSKTYQLSLAASNTAIIFSDYKWDMQRINLLREKMFCTHSPEKRIARLLVQESGFETFKDVMRDLAKPSEYLLPRLNLNSRLEEQRLEIAKDQGKSAYAPIYTDLSFCSSLWQSEILGDSVLLQTFKYAHQAVAKSNANPLGKTVYLLQDSAEKGAQTAQKLNCAQVHLQLQGQDEGDLHLSREFGRGVEGFLAWLDFYSPRPMIY